ncbi:MAG: hypothetical protein RLZZ385_680 [Pseudomonadota bacterium]
MNDILPQQTPTWQYLERTFAAVAHGYGYREIRFPILELTQLFKRSIGEVTDIVEKEMYTFEDRNGDSLSLRPEGTAGCVRAAEQHGLLYNQQQRLWYQGPMFRHERPQKGRYRQFEQFGVEAFGMAGPDIDAEVILLSARFLQALDLQDHVRLEINNIGSTEDRQQFGAALRDYLLAYRAELDEDSRRRLDSNPLRILDSKVPTTRELLQQAPRLEDFVNEQSRQHYGQLLEQLATAGVHCVENPRLVRGLDYYNNAVFEWTTDALGAQGTVCAGGRYDGLVAQLGGRATPAVGFASGKERLVLLLEELGKVPAAELGGLDVYLVVAGEAAQAQGVLLAEQLRSRLPALRLQLNCGGGKVASQIKRAFNGGARVAVILDSETDGPLQVSLRRLGTDEGAIPASLNDLDRQLAALLAG